MEKLVITTLISSIIGVGFIFIGIFFPKDIIFHGFVIIGICILLGMAVKIMDQLIDEIKLKSYKIWIIPLSIFIPASMAYLALTEEPVVGMVIGTAIGIIIVGKLNHPAYILSIILFIVLIVIAFLLQIINMNPNTFYIIPVAALGSFFDEFGHERWKSDKKSVAFIFKHRFFLKIFAFFGVILGFAQIIHLIGFFCFDIFYDLIETSYQFDKKRKKTVTHRYQLTFNKGIKNA